MRGLSHNRKSIEHSRLFSSHQRSSKSFKKTSFSSVAHQFIPLAGPPLLQQRNIPRLKSQISAWYGKRVETRQSWTISTTSSSNSHLQIRQRHPSRSWDTSSRATPKELSFSTWTQSISGLWPWACRLKKSYLSWVEMTCNAPTKTKSLTSS